MKRKIRVLVAKPGLDGHDRGAKIVSQALRDAGIEVIYTGRRQTPEKIVSAALQEDVDAIALSCLSGAHETFFGQVIELLKTKNSSDILIFGGGIIPEEDALKLKQQGVEEILGPGTPTTKIVETIRSKIIEKRKVL